MLTEIKYIFENLAIILNATGVGVMPISDNTMPSRAYHWLFWISGTLIAPMLFFSDFSQLDGVYLSRSKLMVGRDFFNVWTGGSLVISNKLDILYNFEEYLAWQNTHVGSFAFYNYSYPPHSLFLATPFAMFPYLWSLIIWTLLGALFFFWAARPYMPRGLAPFYSVITPAALVNIWAGHYGFVIGGLWLLFFSSLDHDKLRTGIIAGILTLKPHLGLLIAAVMLYRRAWIAILFAISATLFLVFASGVVFGFDLWQQWLFETSALQAKIMTAPDPQFYYLMMPSTFIVLRNMPYNIGIFAHIVVSVIALSLLWRCRNAQPKRLAFVTATTTSLITPYIFNYDLTVCSLGFIVFMYSYWNTINRWERFILWLAFASPLFVMGVDIIAPISLLGGLYVQVRLIVQEQNFDDLKAVRT
jgi:alpha-1,2-mannosyltransferase